METAAQAPATPKTDAVDRWLERRDAVNRANAQHSTSPRTEAGKERSSQNALTHGPVPRYPEPGSRARHDHQYPTQRPGGLTSRSPVLAAEDPAAYQLHCRQFVDEYKPATATETQLTQELADTSWRLNRIPLLEAALLDRATSPPTEQARIDFDIVDAHRALATLGLHGQRLSRQFQKTMENLREIQYERRHQQERDLKQAAAILEHHKHKGIPWDPAQDGFVFSKDQIEAHAQRLIRINDSRHIEHVLFYAQPPFHRDAPRTAGAAFGPAV